MWSSKNRDNPWRLFRRPANRCRSSQSEHDSRNKQTTDQANFSGPTDDIVSKNYNDSQKTEEAFYHEYDDNGNANIFDKFRFRGLRKIYTCDKQTQTDMLQETSLKEEAGRHSASKKVVQSRSCESLVKKSNVKPHTSRSFDISNNTVKNQFNYEQSTFTSDNHKSSCKNLKKSNENISSIRLIEKSVFPEGQGMTDGFYVQRDSELSYDEREEMSQNELIEKGFSAIPNPEEEICIKNFSDEEFYSDLETNLKNMSCQDKTEGYFRNQWSPFHQDRKTDPMFYDYRQPDEVSLTSERSCYSTTSDEADDGYEIIDWNQYTEDYKKEENDTKRTSDAFNTPLTTPTIDLSALDGYHTAPNSPEGPSQQEQLYLEEKKSRQFCDKNVSSDYTNIYCTSDQKRSAEIIDFVNAKDATYINNIKNSHYDQNLCCKCGKSTKHGKGNVPAERIEYRNEANDRKPVREQLRQNQNATISDSRILRLETPPFISVNSLHYEADPETGKAKVIGRGSFGQVYKARFSDPMFCHLPIVIKEFDEEFTNSKEIIEEAKRLHYLQDTGYVPICYGLLCFGAPIQPKYGIVQEYVGTGLTLEQMLWDQYELPLEFWFRIVIQCCEGLARFHEKGILLNDIKTNNILLEFAEHSVRIRYIDFGLATDMRGKRYKNTRSLDDFVYLAPEVRREGRVTNIASDIYSLGYILEQIKKYTSVHELTVVARLCMDRDPDMRIPPRAAVSLIKDHMNKLGFDPMFSSNI